MSYRPTRIPIDHCSICEKRMRCESFELSVPWIRMSCICDDCNIRLVPTPAIYGGKLRHYLEITEHPTLSMIRVMSAWVPYCIARASRELANIWRMRKPFDDPLGMCDV